MLLKALVASAAVLTALAVPVSVDYSHRDGIDFSLTRACAQTNPGGDPDEEGCSTKPNTYCGDKVNKYKW